MKGKNNQTDTVPCNSQLKSDLTAGRKWDEETIAWHAWDEETIAWYELFQKIRKAYEGSPEAVAACRDKIRAWLDGEEAENVEATSPLAENAKAKSSFAELARELVELYTNKNHDYAHGGREHGNFERGSSILGQYFPDLRDPLVYNMTLMTKQLDAALWMLANQHVAKVEGLEDRLRDIAIYSMIAILQLREEKEALDE